MKFDQFSTRRKPVRKTFYARLFNKAKPKRQRASAATAEPEDMEEGSGINISRSLTIIFAIHIVAIGMIFVHKQYLADRTPEPSISGLSQEDASTTAPANVTAARKFSSGDTLYMVKQGDNFTIIATKLNVDEAELRNMNVSREMRAGTVLSVPQGRRIVAEDPPEVAAILNQHGVDDSERGLVEIVPVVGSTQPRLIRPVSARELEDAPRAAVVGSGRTHILKSGENIWRIASKYEVSQKDLMSLNNITDPSKLQIGQVIKLP